MLAYQKTLDDFNFQVAFFERYSTVAFFTADAGRRPDFQWGRRNRVTKVLNGRRGMEL